MKQSLAELLNGTDPVLLDGAMGTQLEKRGHNGGGVNCLLHPDAVEAVHRAYVSSGSRLLIANSLTMNRIYMESHGLDIDAAEVNRASVRLARAACGGNGYVLGNLSSTGELMEPYGRLSEADVTATYEEQAGYLAEAGADGIIIETMFDLREILCAVAGCRKAAPLPVIGLMAFASAEKGGRTIMGNSAEECARGLTEAGAAAVGMNCGDIDPFQMAGLVSVFRSATKLPLVVEPNAGLPRLQDGKTFFDMGPPEFAEGVMECVDQGAVVVGGCCGTGPEHISALKGALSA